MRRNLITLGFMVLCLAGLAQADLHSRITDALHAHYPGLSTVEKIIAISFWDPADAAGREFNQALSKTSGTYQFAKLDGGRKGFIAVAISLSPDATASAIALKRDAGNILTLPLESLHLKEQAAGNYVFDSAGRRIFEDLPAEQLFKKINERITR